MGFLSVSATPTVARNHSIELLHQLECKACPLARIDNKSPHMAPSGAIKPVVYMLGEAPGKDEDDQDEQFVGASGALLRAFLPRKWREKDADGVDLRLRWNNVVRTRPPQNRTPTPIEIECCRPSVARDIAKSKPAAIFGFGLLPLKWVLGASARHGIGLWRGRRFPVNINGYECWYYAFHHPAALLREKTASKRTFRAGEIGSENERAFSFDLKRAFTEIDQGLPEAVVHDLKVASYGIEIVEGKEGDLARLEKLLDWAAKQKIKGFDWETTKLRPYDAHAAILTAAVGTSELSFSWAIDHPEAKWKPEERPIVKKLTARFLRNDTGTKAVQNLSFEQEWIAVEIDWKLLRASRWDCTMTQAHIIDERLDKRDKKHRLEAGPLSLEWLCLQHFGINVKTIHKLDRNNLAKEPLPKVLFYNAMDGKYHCLLFMAQDEIIRRQQLIKQYRMMLKRVSTCVLTQMKGVPADPQVTLELENKYADESAAAIETIEQLRETRDYKVRFKQAFNPASTHDVIKMLRDVMGRSDEIYDEEEGKFSTEDTVLKKIDHPICPAILRLRRVSKLASTYLYKELWPDKLLHSTFNINFTETWRLSSEGPNLQNLPKRDEGNKEVRRQIIAPPGHTIVAFDYGQLEARVIAMITKDRAFCKALWERYDVHGDEAKRLAHAYPSRIGGKQYLNDKAALKKMRDAVKNKWTFPLFFGASLDRVSEEMEIPDHILKPEVQRFQKTFAGVFQWHQQVQHFYREHGYVETLNGVRRRTPLSLNQIINTPVQSGGAEIVMDGMNRISEYADEIDDLYFQPNINIHDDLTFILPTDEIDDYAEKIISEMLAVPYDFVNVPITIEMSVGQDLMHMKEVLAISSDKWKV
jgi:uracil-DNA glycosylase family 4